MRKLVFGFIILILLIAILLLGLQNGKLGLKIANQEQEIKASSNYIENLTSQLQEFQAYHSEISKEEKLKNLLDDYLNEQNQLSETTLTADTAEFNLRQLERNEWFIPNELPIGDQHYLSQNFTDKHLGLDFAAPLGTEVLAAGAGVIDHIRKDKYFGILIEIDHLNGYRSRYAHLAKVLVHSDDLIKKGTTIALVGDTGNSTAPHLHFEILKDGLNQDPGKLLNITNK